MSFDIHLSTCNLGKTKTTSTNRFTGQTVETFVDDGLTVGECAAVTDLLSSVKAKGSNEHGPFVVKFRDKGLAEVFIDGLDGSAPCDGCMVSIRSVSPKLIDFVYELARQGNMLMIPVMEESISIVVSSEQQKKVRDRWPDAVVVGSSQELQILVQDGFGAWQAYREKAVRD
jgi:hypothetical protein